MCCKGNFIFVVISFHIFQAVSKPLTLVRLMRQASRAVKRTFAIRFATCS